MLKSVKLWLLLLVVALIVVFYALELQRYFDKAVAAAQPDRAVAHHLPQRPKGRTIVVGSGKASAQMARAFEQSWDAPIDDSLVVTRYGYGAACERIEIVEDMPRNTIGKIDKKAVREKYWVGRRQV